ncbi:hypothetical protein TorRG33x02_292310 [Trema orientale]|uniref:Uncharacterized protein n=1 Tax=Trema orientale TaxID=63057 RepID=A0A2P5CAC1_TREOI|nr:hypothetical protein TorRG33x02_292310 [Trema orientale]
MFVSDNAELNWAGVERRDGCCVVQTELVAVLRILRQRGAAVVQRHRLVRRARVVAGLCTISGRRSQVCEVQALVSAACARWAVAGAALVAAVTGVVKAGSGGLQEKQLRNRGCCGVRLVQAVSGVAGQ